MPTRYVPAHQLRPAGCQPLQPPLPDPRPPDPRGRRAARRAPRARLRPAGRGRGPIELSLERRVLTVKAERPELVHDADHVFLAERPWGAMSRQIVLGDTLDLDRIEASFDRGVLTVTVPWRPRPRAASIEIGHAPVETTRSEVDAPARRPADVRPCHR